MKAIAAMYMIWIGALLAYVLAITDSPFTNKIFILLTVAGIYQAGWIMGERSEG